MRADTEQGGETPLGVGPGPIERDADLGQRRRVGCVFIEQFARPAGNRCFDVGDL